MSAAPNTLTGVYYDGRTPVGQPATLIWSGATVKLIGAELAQTWRTDALQVSPRVGRADRFVALPDGAQLQCADHPLLERLPQEVKSEGIVAWLESRWPVALACLVLTVGGLGAGYIWGLPAAAERVAQSLPVEYERKLGEEALAWLDEHEVFRPTALGAGGREEIGAGFNRLVRGLPLAPHYQLEFRQGPGPNAFALPGGIVVVTDELVQLAQAPEEVYAVLAHEIGHVEQRHALRNILQNSLTAVVIATVANDAATLTAAVAGLPVLLAQTKYSRQFETEADTFGFELLERRDISPAHFARMMERLVADRDPALESRLSFLSTHPVTAERIARAHAAAAERPAPR